MRVAEQRERQQKALLALLAAMARSSQRMLPAAHNMQRVALAALEPAPIHAVIGLQVFDGRLDSLATAQPAALPRP